MSVKMMQSLSSIKTVNSIFRANGEWKKNQMTPIRQVPFDAMIRCFSSRLMRGEEKVKEEKVGLLKNEKIRYPTMRVVYKDAVTNESAWKIMNRSEALAFAKSQSLDLVLGKKESCNIDHSFIL
jgi:hypothetical protein